MVGTVNNTGIDLDMVAATSGVQKNVGLDIAVSGADTNYALITSGGNVGLGNSAPSRAVEVSASATNTYLQVSTYSTSDSQTSYLALTKSASATINTAAATADGEALGTINFAGVDSSNAGAGAATIRVEQDGSAGSNEIPGRMIFATGTSSATPADRMNIDSAGAIQMGAGAISLKKAVGLDLAGGGLTAVLGGDDAAALTRTNSTNKFCRIGMPHYTNAEEPIALIYGQVDSGASSVNIGGATGSMNAVEHITFNTAADTTTTSGTERMRIDLSGNVGIGVTPDELLHIKSATSAKPVLKIENTNTDAVAPIIEFKKTATDSSHDNDDIGMIEFRALDAGNNETLYNTITGGMTYDNEGAESGRIKMMVRQSNSERNFFEMKGWHGAGSTAEGSIEFNADEQDVDFKVRSNDNEHMFVVNGGVNKIGINGATGTMTPAHTLDVKPGTNGGIVERGGALKENLLTNSGFDVWSNSTLENVGSDLTTNGSFAADSDWTKESGWTITGGNAVVTSGAINNVIKQTITTVVGKLYRIVATCNGYTDGSVGAYTNATSVRGNVVTSTAASTLVFEATSTSTIIGAITLTVGSDFTLSDITFYEVTPGCIAAAGALAFDGWTKQSANFDIWRQHDDGGTLTHNGSFYALKTTTAATNKHIHPTDQSSAPWLAKVRGRALTFGCWVKTDEASHVRLNMYDDGDNHSDYHTGGNAWEWLELTKTIDADAAVVSPLILFAVSGATAYISQPMLVFGSSIGEGNYTRPQGEIVWCEKNMHSTTYSDSGSGSSHSDEAVATVNLEAEFSGKFPKGAKAYLLQSQTRDSGSAGTQCYLYHRRSGTSGASYWNQPYGRANDTFNDAIGWIACNSDGDIQIAIEASGSETFDVTGYMVEAIQLP